MTERNDQSPPLYGRAVNLYYRIRPFIPRRVQIALRSRYVLWKRRRYSRIWPIHESAARQPTGFDAWPEGKRCAVILTHDVEKFDGQDNCRAVTDAETNFGFRSCFFFVPERYRVSEKLRQSLIERGFEVGVHGLKHDGKLFRSRKVFVERARKINEYLRHWNCAGFSAPSTLHRREWLDDLDIEYDTSTYDTDPFEPQNSGASTIFPFRVTNNKSDRIVIEIPYTMPQDFTLFVLMREKNIDIWKKKADWIFNKGGLLHLRTHPDYMNFSNRRSSREQYPARFYIELLEYIGKKYEGQFWHALPRDLSRFWASRTS